MKNLILTSLLLLFAAIAFAQTTPQGMNYQAIARDAEGEILSKVPISIKVTLFYNVERKVIAYDETHIVTTNDHGLFNLIIGQGNSLSGDFEEIPWESEEIYIEIAMDENARKDFKVVNTTKLLTVPYAFHAGSAGKIVVPNPDNEGGRVPWWGQPWWNIEGLEKTDPDKHFIGNIDSVDLVFRTNDLERLRIKASGEVVLPGDVEIGGSLEVKGDSTIVQSLYVQGHEAVIDSFLFVLDDASFSQNVSISNNINVGGNGQVNNNFTVGGNSTVNGNSAVNGNSDVTNNFTVGGTTDLNGQVTIHADITGGSQDEYSEYPLRVEGGDHGVAIKINGDEPNRTRNWITFYNESEDPMGRIEGFRGISEFGQSVINSIFDPINNAGENLINNPPADPDNPPVPQPNTLPPGDYFNNDYAIGSLSESLDVANGIAKFLTNTIACYVGATVFGDCDDVIWSSVDVMVQIIQLGGYIAYNEINVGAAFESGGADYAEWLQKANYEELIHFGEVVGVKGGMISKKFVEAEQFMVVSNNPTIIGAMPTEGTENAFEKIAFMGQVPVKVIGEVELGNYILPSGNGDGMAIAIHVDEMKAKDFSRIIGVAWSTSDGKELFQYINVAVGLNTNDMAGMIENMQLVMNEMQDAIAKMNPDYSPFYFDAEGKAKRTEMSFTSSRPMNEVLAQQIGINANSSKEEAFAAVSSYAQSKNVDLSGYPYLSQILEDPNDLELMQTALTHYTSVNQQLMDLMGQVQKGN